MELVAHAKWENRPVIFVLGLFLIDVIPAVFTAIFLLPYI